MKARGLKFTLGDLIDVGVVAMWLIVAVQEGSIMLGVLTVFVALLMFLIKLKEAIIKDYEQMIDEALGMTTKLVSAAKLLEDENATLKHNLRVREEQLMQAHHAETQ